MRIPSSRSRRRLAPGLLVAAGVVVAVAGCSSSSHRASPTSTKQASTPTSSPSSSPTTASSSATSAGQADAPNALVAQADANAKAQGRVHLDVLSKGGGSSATITQDSGPAGGTQEVKTGPVDAKALSVGGTAYIEGNSDAVSKYFQFPSADVSKLANKWISIAKSDSEYAQVANGLDFSGALAEIGLKGSLTETGKTSKDGQSVIGISGTASSSDTGGAKATLYVSTGATPLPVEFDAANSTDSEQIVLSKWGVSFSLPKPTGTVIAFDSIKG